MFKIDAHHHLWRYSPEEYGWIDEGKAAIRRDFTAQDLEREMQAAGVNATVAVQARQSLEETRALLEIAGANPFIAGVVGWVPLTDPAVYDIAAEFAQDPKLRAVRHVLQDEPDDDYMLREDFNRGLRSIHALGLVYDILIFERHLPQTITFVDGHPEQVFVVDHLAKPRARANEISPWRENLEELAKRSHVHCKISGLATEAEWETWTADELRPYFETALECFGPERLMFGSDWPVCLLATGYERWVEVVAGWIGKLTPNEQERIWAGTAREVYRLQELPG